MIRKNKKWEMDEVKWGGRRLGDTGTGRWAMWDRGDRGTRGQGDVEMGEVGCGMGDGRRAKGEGRWLVAGY